jgi:hypothetical protein
MIQNSLVVFTDVLKKGTVSIFSPKSLQRSAKTPQKTVTFTVNAAVTSDLGRCVQVDIQGVACTGTTAVHFLL